MADLFKQTMTSKCAVGGLHCPCCNDFKNSNKQKSKKKLERIARRIIKQEDKNELDEFDK